MMVDLLNNKFNIGIPIMKNKTMLFVIFLGISFLINIFGKQLQNRRKDIIIPQQSVLPKAIDEQQELQSSKEKLDKKKGLLIFLDDSERDKFGAVSDALLTALYQKAGPIIVSTSLFYNVLKKRKEIALSNVTSRIAFQSEQWVIKKINESLNLLIPYEILKIDKNKLKEFSDAIDGVTDIELQLGLKVNHMKTINYMDLSQSSWSKFADYFSDSLDEIFCKKSDYKNKNMNIPEWFLYIEGHGSINYSIAHLSFDGFKKLLHFLENKMNTRLFVISSCYAAGMNVDKVYGEIKLQTQQYYSFPIIVQALNNVVTSAWVVALGIFPGTLSIHNDFVNFFKRAKELEGRYSDVIKPISQNFIENIPQIKLPGIEWFSVLDADKKIVSIGSILAKTRDPQKPLNVVNFFKKDPELILLYADDIPFELVINSSYVKAIISMISPSVIDEDLVAVTRIKKISSTQNFYDVLDWFKLVGSSQGRILFFIDEINGYKDILIIGTENYGMRVYYKDKNDVLFTGISQMARNLFMRIFQFFGLKKIKIEKVKSGSDHEEFYQEGMHIVREQYPKISAAAKKARQEITSEQIKKIENVLIKQREKQKELATKNYPSTR